MNCTAMWRATARFAFLLGLLASTAEAQCPTVKRFQNYTDGAWTLTGFCDEVGGEGEGALISAIPAADLPIQILRIGVGWRGMSAGATQTESAIQILPGDPLGMTFGPAPLYSYPNPVFTEGQMNVFDVSGAAVPWIVGAQPFVVFVNSSGTTCDLGFVAHDADGCTPNANRFHPLFFPFMAGWYESCVYPFPQGAIGGDCVIWIEYVSTNDCPAGSPHCFGDGTAAPCPCGNPGANGRGCENSLSTGGGRLTAHGTASVSSDSLQLRAAFLPPMTPVLFFQGTSAVAGGMGSPLGDGLRCAGGTNVRMGLRLASSGAVDYGHGVAGDPNVSVAGRLPAGGGSREYQLWYRDALPFCTPATNNLTNAVAVAWLP